jgi:hypothetical protein
MQKLRLNEKQILMLQKLQEELVTTKVLKINEDQYSRIFKGGFNTNKKVSKSIKKAGLDEDEQKIDLLSFAQEVIVFIKDMLSRPESAPFSKYWLKQGISKDKLVSMLEKEGLLTASIEEGGDGTEGTTYLTEKLGFRKKIKQFYNTINEYGDAGYPAGAEFDSNAPWNEPNQDEDNPPEVIKAEKEILKFVYFNADMDGVTIFSRGTDLFVILLSDIDEESLAPYEDKKGWPNGETVYNYVNDKLANKEIQIFRKHAPQGQVSLITPRVKDKLLKWFAKDDSLAGILNQIPESTGAASSGAFVGGMSAGPVKKDVGASPEKVIGDIINDDLDEAIDSTGVIPYHSDRNGEEPFVIDGITWQYVNANYDGRVDIGVYRRSQDITYSYDWFNKYVLKNDAINRNNLEEMDSATAGGESGTFAFDAPAGDGSAFWTAGNKQNKGNAKDPKGMPIVRGGIFTEGIKVGQVYKNGAARRKVMDIKKNPLKQTIISVRQWGDGNATDFKITPKEWGQWDLIHENKKKVLKITEEQLKRIAEADNQTSTAYPNGEMVAFDDCTKLNNNKVAQNGGCSQGDDGVVKLSKTKDSVVAEVSKITGKSIEEVRTIIEGDEVERLIPLFISAINQVDSSLGYQELAKAIGHIINEHYGAHLAERFMSALNQVIVRQ